MENNLMIFENKQVEIFEWNGKILFNPKHVAECLELSEDARRKQIQRMNDKQTIVLKNSDVTNCLNRKLNNRGESFLTESGVYKMIFASRSYEAERFQDWVTDEVLPSIRRDGYYKLQDNRLKELEDKHHKLLMEYDKKMEQHEKDIRQLEMLVGLNSRLTLTYSKYIKNSLGIKRKNSDYEAVKENVLLYFGVERWEQIAMVNRNELIDKIDEYVDIIKKYKQLKFRI